MMDAIKQWQELLDQWKQITHGPITGCVGDADWRVLRIRRCDGLNSVNVTGGLHRNRDDIVRASQMAGELCRKLPPFDFVDSHDSEPAYVWWKYVGAAHARFRIAEGGTIHTEVGDGSSKWIVTDEIPEIVVESIRAIDRIVMKLFCQVVRLDEDQKSDDGNWQENTELKIGNLT